MVRDTLNEYRISKNENLWSRVYRVNKNKTDYCIKMMLQQLIAVPSLRGGRAPTFWYAQNTFLEHQVTIIQQAIMEKGIITFKHSSRLKFSLLFAKLLATNCCT